MDMTIFNKTILQIIVSQYLFTNYFKHKKENLYKNIQKYRKLVTAHNIKQNGLLRVPSQQHIILIITIIQYRNN